MGRTARGRFSWGRSPCHVTFPQGNGKEGVCGLSLSLPTSAAGLSCIRMAADLTPEYLAALRRMTGEQKVRAAFGLYWTARKIKAARIREQHPGWTEEQVQQRVKEIFTHAVT